MIIHKAETRGVANHGWLNSKHSFSFANYYNPDRMNFGVLRVLNDDIIAGGTGFSRHPHDNMEIISIPLEGKLVHKDSMGNEQVIEEGEIQVMSAGTGIFHSEMNGDSHATAKFLQIWVFPNQQNVTPRYDQIKLDAANKNEFQQVLSPSPDDAGVWIHQNAWFDIGNLEKDFSIEHQLRAPSTNGVYAFVLSGSATIEGESLHERDAIGIWEKKASLSKLTAMLVFC
ncbi:MAG: pirin family protein [Flavobacteriales bacterium]